MLIHFLLLLGGRDDTSKSVIVTLSNLLGGATAPPAPPLGTALNILFHKTSSNFMDNDSTASIELTCD